MKLDSEELKMHKFKVIHVTKVHGAKDAQVWQKNLFPTLMKLEPKLFNNIIVYFSKKCSYFHSYFIDNMLVLQYSVCNKTLHECFNRIILYMDAFALAGIINWYDIYIYIKKGNRFLILKMYKQ